MFAVEHLLVEETDIVVTVDCNMFTMSPNILQYLSQHPNKTAWVPKYHETVGIGKGADETFPMGLTAMTAKQWKQITGYDGDLEKFVKIYRCSSYKETY